MVNTHWGGVVEDNSFGTHEFMELCRQLGCEPYVNGNVGSGTVQEMSEWMEYMTFDGVSPMAELRAEERPARSPGSSNTSVSAMKTGAAAATCAPSITPISTAAIQTYVRNYGDNKVFKIACGPNAGDYSWTDEVMEIAGSYCRRPHAALLHRPGRLEGQGLCARL